MSHFKYSGKSFSHNDQRNFKQIRAEMNRDERMSEILRTAGSYSDWAGVVGYGFCFALGWPRAFVFTRRIEHSWPGVLRPCNAIA